MFLRVLRILATVAHDVVESHSRILIYPARRIASVDPTLDDEYVPRVASCGLWHGAAWNFIAWGLYWGLLLVLYRFVTLLPEHRIADLVRIAFMYVLITIGWLIFRVRDLAYLGDYFSAKAFRSSISQAPASRAVFFLFLFYALPLLIAFAVERTWMRHLREEKYKYGLRILGYTVAFMLIGVFAADSPEDFFYFQF